MRKLLIALVLTTVGVAAVASTGCKSSPKAAGCSTCG